ncbi:TLD domain-containing protein [Aspergillus clavatus NRRL 1]|uniref:TLDc domain-containing protein n=1 Tax=Aspergillus clavatus (strain ATCC 1007 / CBS 513.65 / DSM 816 / NCTC 3887 / NRRL 1 / QM 1276 / 107) TaxID=344612 RepID=A1C5Q4_ASPCL|nr:uncharacterized protein ACLA_004360 [Aspergillus clavatus NRRL 1]EAW15022.1 hypothetical protein ACLA_004360 [Aspergillus clavatus NRRL 1]
MASPEYSLKVQEWSKQGLLTPEAVLSALGDRIKDFGILDKEEEQPYLRKTFESLCTDVNGSKVLSQSTFTSFLNESGFLPESMIDAGAVLYSALLYLSQTPFHQSPAEALTFDGLIRAIAWTDYDMSRRVYEEESESKARTPDDTQRILFQSLATSKAMKRAASGVGQHRDQVEIDISGLPSSQVHNQDQDGDKTFQDVMDALYSVQPTKPWMSPVPQDYFRPIARNIHQTAPLLDDLAIPEATFQAFIRLMLFTHFGRPNVKLESLVDLDHAVDCILRRFVQDSDIGITWNSFHNALSTIPELFTGLRHILACFYKTPTSDSLARRLPQPARVATWSVFAQLDAIISDTVCFDEVQFHKSYQPHLMSTRASSFADELNAAPDPLILLVSGTFTESKEKAIFGYFLPWGNGADASGVFLCQLSPVHDVFRGNGTRPGWILANDVLLFGSRGNGVTLSLSKDLKQATVSHSASLQGKPMYQPSAWRGDWQEEVRVEEIEIWVED